MTSKRINCSNYQIIQMPEGVVEANYFMLNNLQAFIALVPHKAAVYARQDKKYELLYEIPSGDSYFTCFSVCNDAEAPRLYLGTSQGQLMIYELALASANFIDSRIINRASVMAIECTNCGVYIQVGNTLFNYQDEQVTIFRDLTHITALAFDSSQFLLYAKTRYKKLDTVVAYDVSNMSFYPIDYQQFHSRAVTAFCISSDTGLLITGDQSGMCVVWDIKELKTAGAKMIYCFKEGNFPVVSLHFSAKYLLIFLLDAYGNAIVMDANQKIVIKRWGCNYKYTSGGVLHEQQGEFCSYDLSSFVKFWSLWDEEE